MFGIFKKWNVVNITTDYAKLSQPIWWFGWELKDFIEASLDADDEDEFASDWLASKNSKDLIALMQLFSEFADSREKFYFYFDEGKEEYKKESIIFLVMFTSLLMGYDKESWEFEKVRHLSQGLYESMEESPAHFLKHNSPLIEDLDHKIEQLYNVLDTVRHLINE